MSIFLSILSAILLILSFPVFDFSFLIWFALVPLLILLDGKRPWAAFGWGYVTGLLFFMGTLYWIIHVTLPGMILLNCYLALYFAIFAIVLQWANKKDTVVRLFLIPSIWVALEYVRGHLFSGFGWATLGESQYRNLPLIQITDVTGAAVISFLIVMVNVGIKEWMSKRKGLSAPSLIVAIIFVIVFGYGILRLQEHKPLPTARVAVIQGNIQQEIKWERSYWPLIMIKQLQLTEQANKASPDIIIWPETSFPGFLWESPPAFEDLKKKVAGLKTPVLVGAVRKVDEDYLNSAILIDSDGKIVEQHDKLHLVPFGEYLPLRGLFPFLADIVPIADFSAGHRYTLLPLHAQKSNTEARFAALICFEDTLPELSREFTKKGAQLLVNITNDAWFKDTNEPFLHLSGAVFRAVENRRSLVRAANTGVSCFIDPYGRITGYVEKNGKKTYVDGFAVNDVPLNSALTTYTKSGDVFTWLCFGCILLFIARKSSKSKRSA